MPNDLGAVKFTYDKCLRVKSINSQKWSQTIPNKGYDACGNLVEVYQQDAAGSFTSTYEYDDLYHLISETGAVNHIYSFDSLHNRISKDGVTHNVNALNQITDEGKFHYEYDFNGNHTKKSHRHGENTYQYDAMDRLVSTVSEGIKTKYLYDSFHRRLKKTSFTLENGCWKEKEAFTFMYQGDKEIGALNRSGKVIEMRTLGIGNNGEIDAAVLMEINDQAICPINDFRGNISTLLDVSDGSVIESYRYSAFGEEQIFDGGGERSSKALCSWRFSSKRVDPETGWVFFRRRYYDSRIGKWTTPDPSRFVDGPNTYCFVHNRPLKYLDHDGRWLSEIIGNNYEKTVNSVYASGMMEYGGVDWNAFEAPNYFYYSTKYKVGTPRNDGCAMTFINGIGNSKEDSMASATMFSKRYGGREVHGVHNVSFGIFFDVLESALGLFGVKTTPSKLLIEQWKDCAAAGNKIIHIGHSQGMIHTKNTIPSCDQGLRNQIDVVAIAPAAHLMPGDFRDTVHHESNRDFVPLFDKALGTLKGEIQDRAKIIALEPEPESPFFDHFVDSPTYERTTKKQINSFFSSNGMPDFSGNGVSE